MPTNDRDHRFFDTADFIAMRDAVVALVNAIIPHYRLVWGGHPAITPIIHDIFKKRDFDYNEYVTIYQSSEDRIVLSHALFWVMTQNIRGHVAKEKYFLLLRQYQEEMLSAYLMESDEFPELLHYCNVMYETLPIILKGVYDLRIDKDARRLAAIAIVAGGYGGDMPEEQCYDLLDDMDFYYNKVKCKKIERMLPELSKMVIAESIHLS